MDQSLTSSSSTRICAPSASLECRRITSPPPANAGAIHSTAGTELRERGFDWWVARIRRSLTLYDIIRLDHFRGFEAYWSIAAEEETAINGQWVKAPGHELFQRLKEVFGDLPFVAEDLGLITKEVDELREHYGMPGMRILQFGFSDRGSHLYLPHRYVPNTVTYTGTMTTTPRSAGGLTTALTSNERTFRPTCRPSITRPKSSGRSSNVPRVPSPTSLSFRCRTSCISARKPA